jgi:hypothetical protein
MTQQSVKKIENTRIKQEIKQLYYKKQLNREIYHAHIIQQIAGQQYGKQYFNT